MTISERSSQLIKTILDLHEEVKKLQGVDTTCVLSVLPGVLDKARIRLVEPGIKPIGVSIKVSSVLTTVSLELTLLAGTICSKVHVS